MSKARDLASGQNGVRPYAMQSGAVTVNATSSASITFTAGRFSVAPHILTTINAVSTAVNAPVSTATPTTSGATLYNSGSVNRVVYWTAVQMTSTSGAG
jgi:hypothetical protein